MAIYSQLAACTLEMEPFKDHPMASTCRRLTGPPYYQGRRIFFSWNACALSPLLKNLISSTAEGLGRPFSILHAFNPGLF